MPSRLWSERVSVEESYSFLNAEIDSLPHTSADRTRLLGVVAHPDGKPVKGGKGGKWRIHFQFRGGATWTTYDDEALWRAMIARLRTSLPGGFTRLGSALVWLDTDKRLGYTTWGVKAERRYYIEFALEGSEYLRVPYEGRPAWERGLRALKEARL